MATKVEDMVNEDLSRSGLMLSDIAGSKVLNHFDVQTALGMEKTPGADGGYSIPFLDMKGNPILDNSRPFLRIRLVGPHAETTPRYLSRPGTSAHVYIPQQLSNALQQSNILLITEGEKKAIRACNAGFPTVALAGINMFRDPRDKKLLLPELRMLLETLRDRCLIKAVVVLFDSDGCYLRKDSLPSDAAEANTYDKLKNGGFVQNKAVYEAGRDLASLIRKNIARLAVGRGWCQPLSTVGAGPKGGKTRSLQHRGIDDVLQTEGGVADLQDWIDKALEKAFPGSGPGGFVPLGSTADGKGVWIWSLHQDDLVDATAAQLTNPAVLAGLVGKTWLTEKYEKIDRQGNFDLDTKNAAIDIASQCTSLGKFNAEGRVFGTGTWLSKQDELVINTSRGVYLPDGTSVGRIDSSLQRKEIYTQSGSYSPPDYCEVSDADYTQLISKIGKSLGSWQYASKLGGDLVLGWMVMSVFLGAMKSRPHLWLVAPRGSGKTELGKFVKSCLGGYAWHTDQGKESTAAGIRQMLQMSSSPCILDEMEKDNTEMSVASERAVANILSLLRSAYTAGSDIKKGTTDQNGRSFRIMTSFCCVSIADPSLDPADLTRIAKIHLKPLVHEGKLSKPPSMLSAEDAAVFFWGTIQRWKQYQALFSAVRDNWLALAGNGESREVDTFGVLIAAALTAHGQSPGDVPTKLALAVPEIREQLNEARDASKESDLILQTLLSLQLDVLRHDCDEKGGERISRDRMTVGRALQEALKMENGDEAKALGDVGIRVATKRDSGQIYVAIALRHASLANLFHGTRWHKDGNWTGGLREVEGVIRNYPTAINGVRIKCTWVPLSTLGLSDDDHASHTIQSRHQFPAPQQVF